MFGAARNCPQSVLPRRTVAPRKCSKTGLAAFQRVQRQQKAEVEPESVEDARDLKAIMDKAEADTRSEVLIFLTPKIVNRASSIGG